MCSFGPLTEGELCLKAIIVLPDPADVKPEKSVLPLAEQPEKICILRLSALGDVTHVLPVVSALRDHWPETSITWIIGHNERRLLQGLTGVEFIEFNKRGGWPEVRTLARRMRKRKFDVLLQMQVAARANLLSRLIHAPVRLGWDRKRSRDGHHWFCNHQVANVEFQHQVEGFLEFAKALGIPSSAVPKWGLPVSPDAKSWVDLQVTEFNWQANAGRDILVISPCSSHPARNWRPEFYARVADFAASALGWRVVLSGGPSDSERQMGRAIENLVEFPCLNLIGKDTLEQSKALLKRADLVISPDAGPAHIASALETPVIGLYAATWSKRSGPYNSLPLCVDRYEHAARKFRKREATELRWGHRIEEPGVMDLILPEDVINKLQQWHKSFC